MATLTYLSLFCLLPSVCYSFNTKLVNDTNGGFANGLSSWYGSPNGAGSDGGACGFGNSVGQPPLSSRITAAAASIYNSGKDCGVCYQVKCSSQFCSGRPVTVVITDLCPECDSRGITFDFSGTSFGDMALPGQADRLRNVGLQHIQYQRVDCKFGVTVTFRVDPGSNGYYFATGIEYENGEGLARVELKDTRGAWKAMQISFGAVWKLNDPSGFRPPFSIRLTAPSGKQVVANNVIPAGYGPGQTYRSSVNFIRGIYLFHFLSRKY